MSEQQQKELTPTEIRNLFIIVQNELNNIKKQHADDNKKLLDTINKLKEELNQKDKEIKSLKKTIDKLIQNKMLESSNTSLNKSLMHRDSKPPIEFTEEEIKYINTFNQKYGTKINGNERILDLSNDNDNNTVNKPNQKLGNDELTYLSKFKFGRLHQLYLGKNNISDISVFANMNLNYLQKLSLANNTIVDISCLEKFNFAELKELYLYNNYISDIRVLAKVKFKNLEKLSLFSNEIKDISILDKVNFPKLQVIRLDNNKIVDISVFSKANFKNLEKLSLFNNNITDIRPLDEINFPALKEIWLNGNGIDMAITENEDIYDKIRDKNIKIIV
jgi:Leucine-rich repeat (LRR) protein